MRRCTKDYFITITKLQKQLTSPFITSCFDNGSMTDLKCLQILNYNLRIAECLIISAMSFEVRQKISIFAFVNIMRRIGCVSLRILKIPCASISKHTQIPLFSTLANRQCG